MSMQAINLSGLTMDEAARVIFPIMLDKQAEIIRSILER
jgi:hypothetical protein